MISRGETLETASTIHRLEHTGWNALLAVCNGTGGDLRNI